MPKVQCNVSVDSELKSAAQKELRRLGMSLSEFLEGCFLALLGDGKTANTDELGRDHAGQDNQVGQGP